MEIRGLGLINVRELFGVASTRTVQAGRVRGRTGALGHRPCLRPAAVSTTATTSCSACGSRGHHAGGARPQRWRPGRGGGPQPAAAQPRRPRRARNSWRAHDAADGPRRSGRPPTTPRTTTAERRREEQAAETSGAGRRAPISWSSPACPGQGSRRRSARSRTWAITASTTCRWRCCPSCTPCTGARRRWPRWRSSSTSANASSSRPFPTSTPAPRPRPTGRRR